MEDSLSRIIFLMLVQTREGTGWSLVEETSHLCVFSQWAVPLWREEPVSGFCGPPDGGCAEPAKSSPAGQWNLSVAWAVCYE